MKCVLYSRKTGTHFSQSRGGREWGELPASFRPLIGIVADCLGIRPHCGRQTRAVRRPPRYPMNLSSGKRLRERSPKDAFTWCFAQNLHCLVKRTTRQPPRRGRSGALPRFTVCERMGMTKLEGNPHAEWLAAYGDPAYWETVAWARVWPRPLEAALRPKNGSWPRSPTVQAAPWNEAAYELERTRRSEIRPERHGSFDVVEKRLQFVEESAGMEAVAYAVMHLQSDGHERAVALRKEFSERKDGKRVGVAFL